jgi:hypothetical protein
MLCRSFIGATLHEDIEGPDFVLCLYVLDNARRRDVYLLVF